MKTLIQPSRLLAQLAVRGFRLGEGGTTAAFSFVRQDRNRSLYQWILVECFGKGGEAVGASVGVSVMRRVAFLRLKDLQLLKEIAQVPERGWTVIRDEAAAQTWEQHLVDIAPGRVQQVAAELGPALLRRTASVREAIRRYLLCLDPLQTRAQQLEMLTAQVGPELAAEAECLVQWPGVLHLVGGQEVYRLACLCLLGFEGEVEGSQDSFAGQNPQENHELMWRIQLLADRLLDR